MNRLCCTLSLMVLISLSYNGELDDVGTYKVKGANIMVKTWCFSSGPVFLRKPTARLLGG